MKQTIVITDTLSNAIVQTIQAIAPDAMGVCDNNDELLEMALDANRLSYFAGAESDKEFHNLVDVHGYIPVWNVLRKDKRFKFL